MPDDISVTIEISVVCEECGNDLSYSVGEVRSYGELHPEIKVKPCETCIQAARDEAAE